jgi:hypothetical protein
VPPGVPVTTISSRPSACSDIPKSSATVWPAATVRRLVTAPKPIRCCRHLMCPTGHVQEQVAAVRLREARRSPSPGMNTWTAAIGCPLRLIPDGPRDLLVPRAAGSTAEREERIQTIASIASLLLELKLLEVSCARPRNSVTPSVIDALVAEPIGSS